MNSKQYYLLSLPPLLLMAFTIFAIYTFEGSAQSFIHARNDIPNIDKLVAVIKDEEGDTDKVKLLNYTKTFRALIIEKIEDDIKFLDLFKNLLYICLSVTVIWIINIITIRKYIQSSNN